MFLPGRAVDLPCFTGSGKRSGGRWWAAGKNAKINGSDANANGFRGFFRLRISTADYNPINGTPSCIGYAAVTLACAFNTESITLSKHMSVQKEGDD